ncbi:MAG: endolytic transglycosylase MltG, partial [Desulfatibacillum sp.]|nr:endolytic transglycosylase MltG [Desulfatibacillum sp.]
MDIKGFAKKSAIIIVLLVLAGAVGIVALGMQLADYANTPLNPRGQEKIVEISRGKGLSAIAKDLENQGLLKHPTWLVVLARVQKTDARIRAGEYALSPSMTPLEILDALVKGKTILYRLTVPEGVTMVQIADLAAKAGFGPKDAFLAKATDPAFAASLGVQQNTLEGYLFPDTYYFNKNEAPEKVIQTMVRHFQTVFTPEWKARAEELGLTVHEVVTLASIIEKETSAPEERDLVSSVNHNRLKKGILLQSDPTVIYGIPDFNGNITRK